MEHRCAWLAVLVLAATSATAFDDHVFVITRQVGVTGNSAAIDLESPWSAEVDLEEVSPDAVARHFFGLHYVVNRVTDEIQVIDPASFDTIARYSAGAGSRPQDILVVNAGSAYVSRFDACDLRKIDPTNGDVLASIDLCAFADADGLPEMSMMALDRNRLFVQIQRLDRAAAEAPVPPSYLAVVDTTTDRLVDVDPAAPGVQAIELTGSTPSYKMQVEAASRRLYVSEPGLVFDAVEGGIEAIDLDTLQALGFVTTESQLLTLDLGPFAMISADKGYVLAYTDFAALTHLVSFSRATGARTGQIHDSSGLFFSLAHDPRTFQVFVPDLDGVQVIDTVSDTRLTASAIATGLTPADVEVARAATPGEARDLLVEGLERPTGSLTLSYRPGCAGLDHNIVFGPLQDVEAYGYSGQVCGIGNSGVFAGFAPGGESYFFLVVATDGAAREGSYGTNGAQQERPDDLADPVCAFTQDLSLRCDPGP